MGAASHKLRVVVGVDFSESSTHAIFDAVQIARVAHAVDLHFVHVLQQEAWPGARRAESELNERLGHAMIELERHVRDAIFVFGGGDTWGCDVAFHLRVGSKERALQQVAVDVDADMIVVGADHRRGLRRLLTRSTTKQLVRRAHVPVIVAHPKDFRGVERSHSPALAERAGRGATHTGLTSYSYVDFGDSRHRRPLHGMS